MSKHISIAESLSTRPNPIIEKVQESNDTEKGDYPMACCED